MKKKQALKIDWKEILKTGKFLMAWVLLFILLYYSAIFALGWKGIENFTAETNAGLLESFGAGKVSLGEFEESAFLKVQGKTILISELCTGWLETALLCSAVLASLGIAWKKRIFGAIAALAFGIAFNQLRIFASIMQLLNTDLQTAELTHDIFFRLSLLAVIAGFYYLWFKKATKPQSTKTRKD